MSNEIIKGNNNLSFSWTAVTGATKYHCRVSKYYDFSIIAHEDTNITVLSTPVYAPTLTGGMGKYYWQWRSYVDSAWNKWQEVQSFERVGSTDLTITSGKWMMFEISEMATYTLPFTYVPQYEITEEQLMRTAERNVSGDLLSEWYCTKGRVNLSWGTTNSLSAEEKNEILRYYGMNNLNVYLACAPISNDGTNYYRKIWKIWFTSVPSCKPLDGNETRFVMDSIQLEER